MSNTSVFAHFNWQALLEWVGRIRAKAKLRKSLQNSARKNVVDGRQFAAKGLGSMKRPTTERLSARDGLLDDPKRIDGYRAKCLAEGLMKGSEEDVLWAWQWLGDHPQFTNRLQEWFVRRVAELREMGRIK